MLDYPTLSEKQFFDFIENLPWGGTVKDSSGRYTLVNFAGAKLMGLSSAQDIKGLTVEELFKESGLLDWKFSTLFTKWNAQQLERIRLLDQKVSFTRSALTSIDTLFTPEGFILFEKLVKIPLLSHDNRKVVILLTMNQDLTYQQNLYSLLSIYQKFYPKKEAIRKLLGYLKIDHYFNPLDLPTCKEMQILFLMRQYPACKHVARVLDITVATASNHINALQNKLIQSAHLIDVLAQLRTVHAAPEV